MKSAFVLHHAVVAIAYPAAFAAEAAGLVPPSVVSLPLLAGYYVGAGVVALACDEYGGGQPREQHRLRRETRRPLPATRTAADTLPTWGTRTLST